MQYILLMCCFIDMSALAAVYKVFAGVLYIEI